MTGLGRPANFSEKNAEKTCIFFCLPFSRLELSLKTLIFLRYKTLHHKYPLNKCF